MKRLFVDAEICYRCGKCSAGCSYFYHQSKVLKEPVENNGVEKFLVYAAQYVVCRRCEEEFCVNSCPNEALEKDKRGILQRHEMRCTSCKICATACPFGTIYAEILPYKTSKCDFCVGRGETPLCVRTCPEGALKYIEVEESPKDNIFLIGDKVAVCAVPWNPEAKAGFVK